MMPYRGTCEQTRKMSKVVAVHATLVLNVTCGCQCGLCKGGWEGGVARVCRHVCRQCQGGRFRSRHVLAPLRKGHKPSVTAGALWTFAGDSCRGLIRLCTSSSSSRVRAPPGRGRVRLYSSDCSNPRFTRRAQCQRVASLALIASPNRLPRPSAACHFSAESLTEGECTFFSGAVTSGRMLMNGRTSSRKRTVARQYSAQSNRCHISALPDPYQAVPVEQRSKSVNVRRYRRGTYSPWCIDPFYREPRQRVQLTNGPVVRDGKEETVATTFELSCML